MIMTETERRPDGGTEAAEIGRADQRIQATAPARQCPRVEADAHAAEVREYLAGLRRRRACRESSADPWTADLHAEAVELTPEKLAAWAQAADHVAAEGLLPILPLVILRAMWREGGARRELAVRVHGAGGWCRD